MNPVELAVLAALDLAVIGATLWLAWVFVSGGRPYFRKRAGETFDCHLVPYERVAEFEAQGWRVVSTLRRSAHGYWSVLMRRDA